MLYFYQIFSLCRVCKKFGTQSWVVAAIIVTELLISCKFEWAIVTKPLPRHITFLWLAILGSLLLWTVWHFYLQRLLWHTEKKLKRSKKQQQQQEEQNNNHTRNGNGKFPNQNGKFHDPKTTETVTSTEDSRGGGRRRQSRSKKAS